MEKTRNDNDSEMKPKSRWPMRLLQGLGITVAAASCAGAAYIHAYTDVTPVGDYSDHVEYVDGSRTLHHYVENLGWTIVDQFCDVTDLVETTRIGQSLSRTVGFVACADGKLTPEDFPVGK